MVRHVRHDEEKAPTAPHSIIVFRILLYSFTAIIKVDGRRIIECKANINPAGKLLIRYRWVIPKAGDAAREDYEALQKWWDPLQTFAMPANNPLFPA